MACVGAVLQAKERHSGVLIGRGGATLKKMMRESGARIDVCKEAVPGRDPDLRDVRITGPQECVEYASCLVEEVLHTANLMDGEIEGSVQRVVELDGKVSLKLLRKAAAALKQIGKQTRTWIRSVKDEESDKRRFTIFGSSEEDVAEAQSLLESRAGVGGPDAQYTKTVPIRQEQVGSFIGRGGERIMELQDRFGILIRVPRDKDCELINGDRHVSLSGDPDKVDAAFATVTELLQQPASGQDAQYTKLVPIRPDQVGSFIGRRGERIMELQDRFGILISVPREKECELTKENRHVSLSGAPDKVDAAFAVVTELLQQPTGGQDAKGKSRKRPLPTEGLVQENIFIDEVDLSYRRQLFAGMEDGFLGDAELFVRGLPAECTEQEIYDHLCSFGARDVQEILLLKRCGKSKRAAYVMFASHASALLARQRLDGALISSLTQGKSAGCAGTAVAEKAERLAAWFSESERCAKGAHSVYRQSIMGLLLGSKGGNALSIKDESGAQEIHLTGANMKSFGVVDNEPRLHLVVTYELGGPDGVCIGAEDSAEASPAAKAARLWERQLWSMAAKVRGMSVGPPPGVAVVGLHGLPPAAATTGFAPTSQLLGPPNM